MSKLTPKQERFCREVVKGKSYSDAYRLAYNTSTDRQATVWDAASKVADRTEVAQRIAELQARMTDRLLMSRAEYLEKLDRMALADMRKVFDPQGNVKDIHEIDQAEADCIEGIEVVENFAKVGDHAEHVGYTKKIKFASKRQILKDYSQARGWIEQDEQAKGPQRIFIRKWETKEVHHVVHGPNDNAGIIDIDSASGVDQPVRGVTDPVQDRAAPSDGGGGEDPSGGAGEGATAGAAPQCAQPVPDAVAANGGLQRRVVRRSILPDLHLSERPEHDDL